LAETSKRVLIEKNPENELQELVYQLQLASDMMQQSNLKSTTENVMPQVKQEFQHLSDDIREAIGQLGNLALLFAKSRQFRRLIASLTSAVSDWLVHVAGVVDESVQESKPQLDQAQEGVEHLAEKGKQAVMGTLGQESSQSVQQDILAPMKDAARHIGDKLKKDTHKLVPDDAADQLRARLQSIMNEVMSRREYHQGVANLLGLFQDARKRVQAMGKQTGEAGTRVDDQLKGGLHSLYHAWLYAKALLEKLGGKSLDQVEDLVRDLMGDIGDQHLQLATLTASSILQRTLTDDEYVKSKDYEQDTDALVQQTQQLAKSPVMKHINTLIAELDQYFDALKQDKLLKEVAAEWSDLMATLFLDNNGRPTLKPELLWDTGKLVMLAAEHLHSIPVGRIEHWDSDMDYTIDHIVLSLENANPGLFELITSTHVDHDRSPTAQHLVRVTIGKIGMAARNIHYFYHKKTMPQLSDNGSADLDLGEDGMKIYFELVPEPNAQGHMFRIGNVTCDINHLEIKIHESHHDILYTLLWPYLKAKMRTALEGAVVDYVRTLLVRLDSQLNKLRDLSADTQESHIVEKSSLPPWSSPAFDVEE
jgi:hypothetical protein